MRLSTSAGMLRTSKLTTESSTSIGRSNSLIVVVVLLLARNAAPLVTHTIATMRITFRESLSAEHAADSFCHDRTLQDLCEGRIAKGGIGRFPRAARGIYTTDRHCRVFCGVGLDFLDRQRVF